MLITRVDQKGSAALLVGAALAFLFLINGHAIGLNAVLWSCLTIGLITFSQGQWKRHLTLPAVLLFVSSFLNLWHNTTAALILWKPNLKYALTTLGVGISHPLQTLKQFFNLPQLQQFNLKTHYKNFKLFMWAFPVVLLFFLFYIASNPLVANHIFGQVEKLFEFKFEQFVFVVRTAVLLLFCLYFTSGLLLKGDKNYFAQMESQLGLILQRVRNKRKRQFKTTALKQEYSFGLILLGLLNLLLGFMHVLDFSELFSSTKNFTAYQLSRMVHQGTYVLIISILVAASIVLILFRKNLNFLKNGSSLRNLALLWLGQNVLLVLTVAIRNSWYINEHGLTHKRLGIYAFLICVCIGLVLTGVKILKKTTVFYILDRQIKLMGAFLLLVTFINWNVLITDFNLSPNRLNEPDVIYLINGLPDDNIGQLLLSPVIEYEARNSDFVQRILDKKLQRFQRTQEQKHWLSWNYTDYKALKTTKRRKQ